MTGNFESAFIWAIVQDRGIIRLISGGFSPQNATKPRKSRAQDEPGLNQDIPGATSLFQSILVFAKHQYLHLRKSIYFTDL